MKKRNIKSITQIFDKNFDLSIFNQIYNDLKNKSNEIIVKEPSAYNSLTNIISYDFIDKSNNNIKYTDLYDNLPKNPTNKNISKSYKSDEKVIRDNILESNYNETLKKKINAYKYFNLS